MHACMYDRGNDKSFFYFLNLIYLDLDHYYDFGCDLTYYIWICMCVNVSDLHVTWRDVFIITLYVICLMGFIS
jgi:hypothetical protein